jgi:hypothetical protein
LREGAQWALRDGQRRAPCDARTQRHFLCTSDLTYFLSFGIVLHPIMSEEKFMQRTTLHLLAMLSVAGSAYACGGDDGDKSPEASTGLPAEAKLSDLESADAPALCDAIEAGIDEVLPEAEIKRLGCTIAAVISMNLSEESSKVDVDKCESYVDECIAGKKTSENGISLDDWSSQTTCDEPAVAKHIEACDATVAEYEACLDSALRAFAIVRDTVRCSAFKDPEKVRDSFTMPEPSLAEECKPLEKKCAGLFDELRGVQVHEDQTSH